MASFFTNAFNTVTSGIGSGINYVDNTGIGHFFTNTLNSTSKLDSFVTDTVFYIMQVIENMSMRFKDYDLSGLTDFLSFLTMFSIGAKL